MKKLLNSATFSGISDILLAAVGEAVSESVSEQASGWVTLHPHTTPRLTRITLILTVALSDESESHWTEEEAEAQHGSCIPHTCPGLPVELSCGAGESPHFLHSLWGVKGATHWDQKH